TNPEVATGDGIALAYGAGARVADLEFVQFHPTALDVAGAPRFLISEALRGEGARLVNRLGEAFMTRYHPDGDLAPRDVVARSIVLERERTQAPICLTLAHLDAAYVVKRFPTIAAMCERIGLDLAHDLIPVGPAAHYIMGGVDTDEWGRTSLPGLYAAGEVACTGLHGANRLASNSLLEGLVFGARAAQAMTEAPAPAVLGWASMQDTAFPSTGTRDVPAASDVRDLMWRYVGLLRAQSSVERAVRQLGAWTGAVRAACGASTCDQELRRVSSIVTVGLLIARAAL